MLVAVLLVGGSSTCKPQPESSVPQPRSPAGRGLERPPTGRREVYFGGLDLRSVSAASLCTGDGSSPRCSSDAEAAALLSTVMVIPVHPEQFDDFFVHDGDRLCVNGRFARSFEEACTESEARVCDDAPTRTVLGVLGREAKGVRRQRNPLSRLPSPGLVPACSGVSLGGRRVMTANHCVQRTMVDGEVRASGFVVTHYVSAERASSERICFPKDDVHEIVAVLPSGFNGTVDVGVVEVAPGRELPPGPALCSFVPEPGRRLYLRGHPYGLPQFWSGNAARVSGGGSIKLETSLDTFEGNSGSPVFDEVEHCLVGVSPAQFGSGETGCCGFVSMSVSASKYSEVISMYAADSAARNNEERE